MEPKEYGEMINKYAASGAIAVSISLAKDVGILDILYQAKDSLTSHQIADKGRLKERYVREVMGALVTGGVVQVDKSSTKFHLKQDLRPVLKGAANLAGIPVYFGQKYNAIKECFPQDGPSGVPISENPEFYTNILDDMRTQSQDGFIENDLLPTYLPLRDQLKSGVDALEVGSATGTVLLNLSKRFPESRFTGTDLEESGLEIGKTRAADRGIKNCTFTVLNVCKVPDTPTKQYDWILAQDVIHDLPRPQDAIKGIFRLLKPGGVFTMVDPYLTGQLADHVGELTTSFFFTSGTFVCVPDSYQEGKESVALGPCSNPDAAKQRLIDAGFDVLNTVKGTGNPMEFVFICQKPN